MTPGFRAQVGRPTRYMRGLEAELRVGDQLSKYGHVEQGLGTDGEPDLRLNTDRARYSLEVKSMLPYHLRAKGTSPDPGRINLDREAWESMATLARRGGRVPVLVVEVRIKTRPNLFHWITEGQVDQWMARSPGVQMIHVSLYDLPVISKYSWRPGVMDEIRMRDEL